MKSGEVVMSMFARFVKDESGATAIEYGLLASLISVGIITIVASLGGKLNDVFTTIDGKLDSTP
jgi:pilus assembly protein Flp/PilA